MRTLQTIGAAAAARSLRALVVFGSRRRDDRQPGALGIGSQSTGAGAGKVNVNPFSIRRKSASNDASGVFLVSTGDNGDGKGDTDFQLTIGGAESPWDR